MVRRQHPRYDRGASHALQMDKIWRVGVRRRFIDCEDRLIVEPRSSVVGISESRRADGREVEVVTDEFHDRRSRCAAPVCGSEFSHCGSFQSRESGVRDARYGLRGTRVGEASHPGPHSDVPDDIWDDLEFRLGRMDSDSDDEPLQRPLDGRNVVPKDVASSVPVTVDTVPADVESTMPISTVPASSGRVRAVCASKAPKPRKSGVQEGPEGWGPEACGPEAWRREGWVGEPKFRAFFSLSHHNFRSFFSLWVSSRGILVVF